MIKITENIKTCFKRKDHILGHLVACQFTNIFKLVLNNLIKKFNAYQKMCHSF